jgi:flagellar hook-associated protein 1 FlgK
MANIFSIAQSALVAAQAGINTTGQNIANAATPGYSRQSVQQVAILPDSIMGYANNGSGVQVASVQRAYNAFLADNKISAQATSSQLQTQYDQIQQINNMLSDPDAGLSPAMQEFFNGLHNLSLAPGDEPAREALLTTADALTSRFNDLQDRLKNFGKGINDQITTSVDDINNIAEQISVLNSVIGQAQTAANGKPVNDLLDARDKLVDDLSKQVKANVVRQDDRYDVYIANGQPLVVNGAIYKLYSVQSASNASQLDVAYGSNDAQATITPNNLGGGALRGLLDFRSGDLAKAQSSLTDIMKAFAENMNDQNAQGFTADGNPGGDFFAISADGSSISLNLTNNSQIAAASSNNPVRSGDNGNILKMIDLQTKPVMNAGTISFQTAYAKMVNQIGSKTRELELSSTSADNITKQADAAIQNVSGVNLDEEAANLLRYQQAYQAAGKVIQTSQKLFDSLLAVN